MLVYKSNCFILGILKTNSYKILKIFKRVSPNFKTRHSNPYLKLILVVFIFGFQGLFLNAQLIDNEFGQAFTDEPFFNSSIVKKHKIKSITGRFVHYKLGDRLRQTEYFRKYIFNEEGQLIQLREFTLFDYKSDTSVNDYKYDNKGNMIESIHTDRNGSYGYFYEYDDKNRLVYLEYRRKYGKNETKDNKELGVESIVYSEKSTYTNYPRQQKETVYNTSNSPYRDNFIYYDVDNFIIKKTERLRRTLETINTIYSYNEDHLVDTIKATSISDDVQNRMYVFVYDDNGFFLKKKEFKNGELIAQYEVIYDKKTKLINDFLIQDVATNFIRDLILDKYEYFED